MAFPVQFLCRGLRIIGLVLLYYVFSIGITFYNKWLMTVSGAEPAGAPRSLGRSVQLNCFFLARTSTIPSS